VCNLQVFLGFYSGVAEVAMLLW